MLISDRLGGRHSGLVPVLLSCTLMVAVLLGLVLTDAAWSGPVIAVSLVVCLALMIAIGRRMHWSETRSVPNQGLLPHAVHQTVSPDNRREDTEAIRAMLRSRPIVFDGFSEPEHLQVRVTGMTCAAEAAGLAHALNQCEGVTEAVVNPLTERAYVTYEPLVVDVASIETMIQSAGYGVE